MDEPTLESLARRLARLERENRWLKRIGAVLVVVAAAGGLMGQVQPTAGTVESQRFVVKDAAGWSNLQVFDRAGTSRLATGVAADGAAVLVINDSSGTTRAGLGIAADDHPFRFP